MQHRLSRAFFGVIATSYFALLAVLLFGDALLDPKRVISAPIMDIDQLFYPLREFAFGQMRAGHLPLWNPYVMGGIPAFGNSLYALLYPPNWLHLVLPMNLTINLLIASHVMFSGLFTAIWCRWRGASVVASLIAGSVFMFCGPQMMRVYGGILTYPCVIAWTPLLFLCLDAIVENRRPGAACLAGAAILTLQIFAGYMLATYYQFFGILIYVIMRLINQPRWRRAIAWVSVMCILGGALSAVQLLPGMDAAVESVRGTAHRTSFSTSFSVAPENLLTLVAPFLFGDWVSAPIFTRWGIVDTSLFIGAVGAVLAAVGVSSAIRTRSVRDLATFATLVLVLTIAMGQYNPLYGPLMRVIPGLAIFRGPSRCTFLVVLAAAALAASGFDHLRQMRRSTGCIVATSVLATLFLLGGLLVGRSADSGADGLWGMVLTQLVQTGETWYKLDTPAASRQIQQSAILASHQLIDAGGVFAITALIVTLAQSRPQAIYLLHAVALVELWNGSILAWDRFLPQNTVPPAWTAPLSQLRPDDRVLVLRSGQHNLPMQFQIESIGGYDPALRQRWEDVVGPLLGSQIHTGNLDMRRFLPSNRWPMLRLGVLLPPNEHIQVDPPMPRLNLISEYVVVTNPDESIYAIRQPTFDPRKTVVLESQPDPKPVRAASGQPPGSAHLLRLSTDDMEIVVELSQPTLLLITDAYSSGWRARPIEPGPQLSYQILPADHALRAIPLAAGKHHILLEYRPRAVAIGLTISLISLLFWISWCCVSLWRIAVPQASSQPMNPP